MAVLGGTGFVGSAVCAALTADHEVVLLTSPRLETSARSTGELLHAAAIESTADLEAKLQGIDTVVNAAGDPDASSLEADRLFGANALMPGVVLLAAGRAGVERLVHVSSAVVQNDKATLDDSDDMRPFSPYSASKVAGRRSYGCRQPRFTLFAIVRRRCMPRTVASPGWWRG